MFINVFLLLLSIFFTECTSKLGDADTANPTPGCDSSEIVNSGRNTVGVALTSSDEDKDTSSDAKKFGWTVDDHKFTLAPEDSNRIGDLQTSFTIDLQTGQIAVALDATLDFESSGPITLYVEVTDQNIEGGWSTPIKEEGNLLITLTNINERPVANEVGPFYFLKGSEIEGKGSKIGTEVGVLTA